MVEGSKDLSCRAWSERKVNWERRASMASFFLFLSLSCCFCDFLCVWRGRSVRVLVEEKVGGGRGNYVKDETFFFLVFEVLKS